MRSSRTKKNSRNSSKNSPTKNPSVPQKREMPNENYPQSPIQERRPLPQQTVSSIFERAYTPTIHHSQQQSLENEKRIAQLCGFSNIFSQPYTLCSEDVAVNSSINVPSSQAMSKQSANDTLLSGPSPHMEYSDLKQSNEFPKQQSRPASGVLLSFPIVKNPVIHEQSLKSVSFGGQNTSTERAYGQYQMTQFSC